MFAKVVSSRFQNSRKKLKSSQFPSHFSADLLRRPGPHRLRFRQALLPGGGITGSGCVLRSAGRGLHSQPVRLHHCLHRRISVRRDLPVRCPSGRCLHGAVNWMTPRCRLPGTRNQTTQPFYPESIALHAMMISRRLEFNLAVPTSSCKFLLLINCFDEILRPEGDLKRT